MDKLMKTKKIKTPKLTRERLEEKLLVLRKTFLKRKVKEEEVEK